MKNNYDYIVVGAGSAGCVISNRLSEDADADIILLEAGEPDDDPRHKSGLDWPELMKTDVDWDYQTLPQDGLNERRAYHPRGKVIGGSSSLNAMAYQRGHPSDWDQWEELGNNGWGYDEMLPYFKKAEHFEGGESKYRGSGGPLNITKQEASTDITQALREAFWEVGFPRNEDFNAGKMEGAGRTQVNMKDGERHSTADAYLRPALNRNNLSVETNARVTKLQFDGDRIVGLEFEQGGQHKTISANREVILSAGTFNSPHLLLLSGIGDADHLDNHGVEVENHLPGVGQNLHDHLCMPAVVCRSKQSFDLAPWSNVTESNAFERTDPDLPAPNLAYFIQSAYFMNHGFSNPEDDDDGFTILGYPTRPRSRGEVTLQSPDPMDKPLVDPNYLSDETDLELLIEVVKRAREISQAEALSDYRGEEIWPGQDVQTDEEIAEHIRNNAQSLYHPVGTCKMGSDNMAVVDDRLRVHGVDGLRVVDASIMPQIVSPVTQAPTIGIAEKASDMIKEERA